LNKEMGINASEMLMVWFYDPLGTGAPLTCSSSIHHEKKVFEKTD
jgi:hypothetical protein